jgi:hypothetical protein
LGLRWDLLLFVVVVVVVCGMGFVM